jgi:hypothetical protein
MTPTPTKPPTNLETVTPPARCEETVQKTVCGDWVKNPIPPGSSQVCTVTKVDKNDPSQICDSTQFTITWSGLLHLPLAKAEPTAEPPDESTHFNFVRSEQDPHCVFGTWPLTKTLEFISFDEEESSDCLWEVKYEDQSAIKFDGGEILFYVEGFGRNPGIVSEITIIRADGTSEILPRPADGQVVKYELGPVTMFVEAGDCTSLYRPSRCLNTQVYWPENLDASGLLPNMFTAAQVANTVIAR